MLKMDRLRTTSQPVVVEDSNLAAFTRRLYVAENQNISFQHKLTFESLQVKSVDVRPITLRCPSEQRGTFSVNTHLCEFSYSYRGGGGELVTQPMEQMVAFSVGDLLRYVYQNNKVLNVPNNKELSETLTALLAKAQKIEIGRIEPTNWLGEMTSTPGAVLLWDSTSQVCKRAIPSSHRASLDAFCHSLVFNRRHRLVFRLKGQLHEDRKGISNMLSNLATSMHAIRLLRYFLDGSDPFSDPSEDIIYTFDPPMSMPDIALRLFQETGDDTYQVAYKRLTKRVNRRLQSLLETKYTPATFKCVSQVPHEYPEYALRNVHLHQCSGSDAKTFGVVQFPLTQGLNTWRQGKYKLLQPEVRDNVLRQVQERMWRSQGCSWKNSPRNNRKGQYKADNIHSNNLLSDAKDQLLEDRKITTFRPDDNNNPPQEDVQYNVAQENEDDDDDEDNEDHYYSEPSDDDQNREEQKMQEAHITNQMPMAFSSHDTADENGFRVLNDSDVQVPDLQDSDCEFELI